MYNKYVSPSLFFASIGAFFLIRYFTIGNDPIFAALCNTVSPTWIIRIKDNQLSFLSIKLVLQKIYDISLSKKHIFLVLASSIHIIF